MSEKQQKATAYWKENLKYLVILLTIWFLVRLAKSLLLALTSFPLSKITIFSFGLRIAILIAEKKPAAPPPIMIISFFILQINHNYINKRCN